MIHHCQMEDYLKKQKNTMLMKIIPRQCFVEAKPLNFH
jgi:hypothetical protein